MFSSLQQQLKALNADVKSVTQSEKAKKLRKKLFSIGIPLTVLGFGGVLISFILFTVFAFQTVNNASFDGKVFIPFFFIIPCALIGAFGAGFLSAGLKIVVTDYTASAIDEAVGNNCPACKKPIYPEANFCGECGATLIRVCPSCQKENPLHNGFCEACGTKLE